jgi:flagellar M-ring protein FliF
MGKNLSQFFGQLGQIWTKVSINQRVTIVLVGVIFMAGLWVMASVARRPSWGTLYSGISQEESGKICSVLRDENVPIKLKSGGRTIMVPEGRIDEMKVILAEKRLLPDKDRVSSVDLFSSKSFAEPESMQQIRIKKDTESSIARNIMAIDAVDYASVMLAIPESSIFDEALEVKASVMLTLNDSLGKKKVQTVQYLVSHAVAGLKKEYVTVVDSEGNTLSAPPGDDGMGAVSSSNLEYQREVEKRLTESAQSMLDRAIGPGKSTVTVSALINFRSKEEIRNEPIVAKSFSREKTTERTSKGGGAVGGGAVGASQASGTQGGSSGATQTETEDITTETEYPEGLVTTKTVEEIGDIKKLTVAVTVDSEVDVANIPKIEEIVKKAVGFTDDGTRVDEIAVNQFEFPKEEAVAADKSGGGGGGSNKIIMMVLRNAGALVGVVLVMRFFTKTLKKTKIDTVFAPPPVQYEAPVNFPPQNAAILPTVEGGVPAAGPPPMQAQPAQQQSRVYMDKMSDIASEDPEKVAKTISQWIEQD